MSVTFPIDAALVKNEKFRDLSKRLAGNGNAAWALMRLWSFAALYRPDGDLTGIEISEIPLTAVEWKSLVEARKNGSGIGFLHVEGDFAKIHDWGMVSSSMDVDRRREIASIAGRASWEKRKADGLLPFQPRPRAEGEIEEPVVVLKKVTRKPTPLIDPALERYLDLGFEWFYEIYPKREGRSQARKAWTNLHRYLLTVGERMGINKAVKVKIAEYVNEKLKSGEWEATKERKQYIPYPATFLNQRRWED